VAEQFTAAEKLDCLKRELTMRRHVFPRRVKQSSMSQAKANREIALIEAMIDDYRIAVEGERLL
jgi:hypothetical protein